MKVKGKYMMQKISLSLVAAVLAFSAQACLAQAPAATHKSELISQNLLQRFNTASDYRPLVFDAIQTPKSGGHFYAYRILKQCASLGIHSVLRQSQLLNGEASSGSASEREKAVSLLNARCGKFTEDELSNTYIEEVFNQGKRQGDPLVLAVVRALADGDRRKSSITAVKAFPDPLLIDEIGLRLLVQSKTDHKAHRKEFRVDGKNSPIGGSASEVDAGLALSLVPCKLGLRCDSTEFDTALKCASGGGCDAGRAEALKQALATKPEAASDLFDRTDQLATRMANSLLRKGPDVFAD